jgi:hypothetical protein
MINGPCRAPMRRLVAALLLLPLGGAVARAQETFRHADSSVTAGRRHASSFGVWTARAHDQWLATRLGGRQDRGLFMLGLQRRWPLAGNESGTVDLSYTVDLLPVVLSSAMPDYLRRDLPCAGTMLPCTRRNLTPVADQTVYAFGAAPIGFVARFGVTPRLDLQLRTSGGALFFTQPIPDPASCKFNFSADVGAAADVRLTSRLALAAGVRLNHISNGNRSRINPGMNSRMVELGLTVLR